MTPADRIAELDDFLCVARTFGDEHYVASIIAELRRVTNALARYDAASRELPEVRLTDGSGNDLYSPTHCNEVIDLCTYAVAMTVKYNDVSRCLEVATQSRKLSALQIEKIRQDFVQSGCDTQELRDLCLQAASAVAMKAENKRLAESLVKSETYAKLEYERAEKAEAALDDANSRLDALPTGDLQKLGAMLADMLDSDRWNNIEPYLEAARLQLATARQQERERIALVFDAMQHTGNMSMAAAIVRALTDKEPS